MTALEGTVPSALRSVTGLPRYVLPFTWTAPPLSLNDPTPRGKRARGARAAKVRDVRAQVVTRLREVGAQPWPHLHVVLHYVPRDNRARDADNLVATLKPAIDALTAAGMGRGWICAGLVPDDTPEHVSWSPPVIHRADGTPRLWLVVQACAKRPEGVPGE